ncbi:hypothetical protein OIU80_19760 [Flavobacterium sp. LS1R47]|uniref:Uncharacterized protein n=1 Tax=Flavobacterium frigoritolerans TaxID=2987686 RepID=A0A9X3HP60_9FLAO|nr:hypothetical protein [Flavobacterium frigoritolerans]MCV9934523.1 hypothetical protein [Flavobacterium frigoritolerans]
MTTTNPKLYTGNGSAVDNYNKPKNALKTIVQGVRGQNKSNWGLFDKNNQQHKTILSLLQQLQWVVASEKWGQVADISRLSEFLKSDKTPVKKPLKDMEPEEVSKIIECFKSMIIKKYK